MCVVVEAEPDLPVDQRLRSRLDATVLGEGHELHDRDPVDVPMLGAIAAPHERRPDAHRPRTRFRVLDVLLRLPATTNVTEGSNDEVALADVDDDRVEPDAPSALDLLRQDVVLRLRHQVGQHGRANRRIGLRSRPEVVLAATPRRQGQRQRDGDRAPSHSPSPVESLPHERPVYGRRRLPGPGGLRRPPRERFGRLAWPPRA